MWWWSITQFHHQQLNIFTMEFTVSDNLSNLECETLESNTEPASTKQFIEKKVADLSIADVLSTPLFVSNLRAQINDIWDSREVSRKNAAKDNKRLKSHVIDILHADGLLDASKFAVLFAQILDKRATGYSSNDREFIRSVGMMSFKLTMQQLIEDEKKRDNSNWKDK